MNNDVLFFDVGESHISIFSLLSNEFNCYYINTIEYNIACERLRNAKEIIHFCANAKFVDIEWLEKLSGKKFIRNGSLTNFIKNFAGDNYCAEVEEALVAACGKNICKRPHTPAWFKFSHETSKLQNRLPPINAEYVQHAAYDCYAVVRIWRKLISIGGYDHVFT